MPHRLPSRRILATLTAVMAVVVAACGSSAKTASPASTSTTGAIDAKRCAANRAAGTITYLTGFGYQASVGILDPIAAQALGYYRAVCLNVDIKPGTGDPGGTAQLTAAGKATISELGAPSDAITVHDNGIDVTAIATYGNVPAITLLTMATVTNLKQLEGKTLGYKGSMPPQITAMLTAQGVDVAKIHEVGVGYDPTVLPRGQVQALTAYKSNEPVQLRDQGFKIHEWDPDASGIKGSFNVLVANPAFAPAHPDAVEDFLRATFEAYQHCQTAAQACAEDSAKLQSGYDVAQNVQRWGIESGLVNRSLLAGKGVGAESVAQWQPEATLLLDDHLIKAKPDLGALIDTRYVNAIYHGSQLIWPAP